MESAAVRCDLYTYSHVALLSSPYQQSLERLQLINSELIIFGRSEQSQSCYILQFPRIFNF